MDSQYFEKLRKSPKIPFTIYQQKRHQKRHSNSPNSHSAIGLQVQEQQQQSPPQSTQKTVDTAWNISRLSLGNCKSTSTSPLLEQSASLLPNELSRKPPRTPKRKSSDRSSISSPDPSCRYIPNRSLSDLEYGLHSPSPAKKTTTSLIYSYPLPSRQSVRRLSPPIFYRSSPHMLRSLVRNRARAERNSRRRSHSIDSILLDDSMIDEEESVRNRSSITNETSSSNGSNNGSNFIANEHSMSLNNEEIARNDDEDLEEQNTSNESIIPIGIERLNLSREDEDRIEEEEERLHEEEEPAEEEEPKDNDNNDDRAFTVGIGGNSSIYDELLRKELLPNQSANGGIFRFEPAPAYTPSHLNNIGAISPLKSIQAISSIKTQVQRKISNSPYKVLDAPGLLDDYYVNLVDWGATNLLAVGLRDSVYLWNAATAKVVKICDVDTSPTSSPNTSTISADSSYITSVSWISIGTQLAVGNNQGLLQLWDVTTMKKIRTITGHTDRIGCISWNSTNTLSTGSRDKFIIHHDVRASHSHIVKLLSHTQEVCGLKWSPDGKELASGGNDNKLNVWQPAYANCAPVIQFDQHTAAVKALAWSPHQHGLLASGGGTNDRCIRFWNTITQTPLNYVDTGSQVCNLAWSENVNEIVSTHGYSQNQIYIWKYPSMVPIATLTGHSLRVLYLAVSPDGQSIVTGAGDETLRLWNIFPQAKKHNFLSSMPIGIR